MVVGRTVMLPKGAYPAVPGAQRTITCLNVMYKLLTGTLAAMLIRHVQSYQLLPPEQKALRKGARGCLDAHIIKAAVAPECKDDCRDCFMIWLDFRKAFNLVPHRWLRKMLQVTKAPQPVLSVVRKLLPLRRTNLEFGGREGRPMQVPLVFKQGLFQGDTLSPLLFGLALALLSSALRCAGGFKS